MKRYLRSLTLSTVVVLAPHFLQAQAAVTIDKSIQFQKIDGFGTQYGRQVYWDPNPVLFDEDHLRRVIDELGISMHRTFIDAKLEMVNDNDDANNTDLQKYKNNLTKLSSNVCEGEYISHKDQISIAKAYKERALKNGDTIKFHGSVISPPHWMKYIKCTFGLDANWNRLVTSEEEADKGGTAEEIKDRKDEFAEWLYATTRVWKDEGVEFYAMGIQNEAAFPEPYGSCVYSSKALAGVVAKVDERFDKEGLSTKIIYPEDIGDLNRLGLFMKAVVSHPVAKKYSHILGVHQYTQDGVTPGSLGANAWTSINSLAGKSGGPLWMTETSGFGVGVPGMMKMATQLYAALKFGKVSAWNWLSGTNAESETEDSTGFFVLSGGKQVFTKKANAFRHYSRHIRPGAISVQASCESDVDVLPLAFQDNYRKKLVVVLINVDPNVSKTVSLRFTTPGAPKKFLGYVSSATQDYQKIDSINSTATITLPPNSISTYIGNNSTPVVTATEGTVSKTDHFEIYPNPANDRLTIQMVDSEIGTVELYDPQMKFISSYKINNRESQIDLQSLPNGIYYLKIGNQVKKVVVSKD
ncbi:MAG TPA: T9SS type A sorting domain-containing protein [Cytophagaceae bacterium]|jgi:O-glycosyl hydrolase